MTRRIVNSFLAYEIAATVFAHKVLSDTQTPRKFILDEFGAALYTRDEIDDALLILVETGTLRMWDRTLDGETDVKYAITERGIKELLCYGPPKPATTKDGAHYD